jgi:hypothetical protein
MTREAFSSFLFFGPGQRPPGPRLSAALRQLRQPIKATAQTAYQGGFVEGLRGSSLAPSASCESV